MSASFPTVGARPARGRRDAWILGPLVILVILPAAAAALSLVGRRWFPSGDEAFIARRVADVGGRHTPSVGVYSRFGWDHPGPLLFWLLAPLERLGGDTGILCGTAGINAACLGGALMVAYRRGGAVLTAWVALFLAVLCHALGAGFLLDPWNPWLPVTGLALLLLLGWSVGCGDQAMWPWLVGVASWEIQAHVGFAAVVLAVAVFVTGCRTVAWGRSVRAGASGASSASGVPAGTHGGRWAIAIALGLWAGPIVQQLTGRRGDLEALLRFSLRPSGSTLGFGYGVHVAARELSLSPPWATGHDANPLGLLTVAPVGAGLMQLALLAGLGWLAWRREHGDAATLAAVTLVAVAGGVAGLTRVVGVPFPYLARWMWIVAMFVPLATGWCLLELVRPWRRVRAGAMTAVVIATSVVVGVTTIEGVRPALPAQPVSDALAGLVPGVERALDRRRTYVLVASESDVVGPVLGPGLQAALERRGYQVRLPPTFAFQVGAWRTASESRRVPKITILSATDPSSASSIPPGWTSIGHWDPLTPAQRDLATSLARSIRSALGPHLPASSAILAGLVLADADYVAHGAAADALKQLARLQRLGQTYDIYLVWP
jgi:hypothetical protein